jgi:dienelactone hydrolase
MNSQSLLANYRKNSFLATTTCGKNISHDVYSRGNGPPVLIIQELPGMGLETFRLADKFIERGFTVYLPHLFGPIGKLNQWGNLLRVFCMRREFSLLAKNKSSPIVDWLKALCRDIKARQNAPGVGVIGMCLTGNFAISLMADSSVLAAVSSQPSLPVQEQDALHMSDNEIEEIKANIDATAPIKAYRFEGDSFCQKEKFERINSAFNGDRERVKLTTLPGKGHAVLTIDFVDQEGHPTHTALEEVLSYFDQQLN